MSNLAICIDDIIEQLRAVDHCDFIVLKTDLIEY